MTIKAGLECYYSEGNISHLVDRGCTASLYNTINTLASRPSSSSSNIKDFFVPSFYCMLISTACRRYNVHAISIILEHFNFLAMCDDADNLDIHYHPLHECVSCGCVDCCTILISKGKANVSFVLSDGTTVLNMIPRNNDGRRIAKLILETIEEKK